LCHKNPKTFPKMKAIKNIGSHSCTAHIEQ
jgi:hypothetical protein